MLRRLSDGVAPIPPTQSRTRWRQRGASERHQPRSCRVVGPGVEHRMDGQVERQAAGIVLVESIVEQEHPREAVVVPELPDRGGHRAPDPPRRGPVNRIDPGRLPAVPVRASVARCPFVRSARRGANVPGPLESHEMIDPHDVEALELCRDPARPPVEVGLAMRGPAILRVAPELAPAAETIRWDTGDRRRSTGSIELEEFRVGLDVGGFQRHEDRQVTEDPDSPRSCSPAHALPLLLELELHEGVVLRITAPVLRRPVAPMPKPFGRVLEETTVGT